METANTDIQPNRFEAEGKTYVLKYTIERVDLYENAHGSIGRMLYTSDVFLKYSQLVDLLSFGIKEEGGEFVNPQEARELAANLIETNGYLQTIEAVFTQLKDDCGFLFVDVEGLTS